MGISPHKMYQYRGENYEDMPLSIEKPYYKEAVKAKEDYTPWERVKLIFEKDEFGDVTPELLRIKDSVSITFLGAGIFGGVGRGRIAYQEFFKANAHTTFETPFHARRQLQDKVVLGFGSGFAKLGWRAALFVAMFSTTATCIAAYRGKMAILDQVGGGATAGFLYKFPEGPKSMVAGVVVGAGLGLMAGFIQLGLTKISGSTPDDYILQTYIDRQERRMKRFEETRLKNFPSRPQKITLEEIHQVLSDEEAIANVIATNKLDLTTTLKVNRVQKDEKSTTESPLANTISSKNTSPT